MTISVSSRKAKGRSGEMEILALHSNIMRAEYEKRGWPWPEHGILKRGPNGKDIVGLKWLAPEVKRHEKCNDFHVEMWWGQAKSQITSPECMPVLFWRPNHSPWHVRMFGRLNLLNGGAVRCTVDISIGDYLLWFKHEFACWCDSLSKKALHVVE
jgi:hypothetical protein